MRGLRENAARGFQNGSIPFGYRAQQVSDGHNKRTKLEPDPQQAPIVKRIFDLCLQNKGIKEIAKTLNKEGLKTAKNKPFSNSSVQYILNNEAYTGTLVYGKKSIYTSRREKPFEIIRIQNNHPAIIDKRTFQSAHTLMQNRTPQVIHPRQVASPYLLSGMIYCGKCGYRMIGCSAKSGAHFYYGCHNYSKRGKDISIRNW